MRLGLRGERLSSVALKDLILCGQLTSACRLSVENIETFWKREKKLATRHEHIVNGA